MAQRLAHAAPVDNARQEVRMSALPRLLVAVVVLACACEALAQGLPTSQPNYLTIIREEVKIGRDADHEKVEAGWPAAFEKAKSPDYYLAAVSLTGRPEVWFISPSDSHKAAEEGMRRERTDPFLSVELPRLSRLDGELLTSLSRWQFMARKDLSLGAFPDTSRIRFYDITLFRMRPGHQQQFEAAARAYGSAAKRSAPTTSYRVYELMAGAPGPMFMVMSSVQSYGEFDQMMNDDRATMKGATEEERKTFEAFGAEGLVNAETQRFRVDPGMSYVPKETRASDPAFWTPKKPSQP
jgi:hypothetical protein